MSSFRASPLLVGLLVFCLFFRRAHAFGAGNIAGISKVEGQNWRHGDIEDTLLKLLMARAVGGKKFDKLSVSRVYFGNWLRDYSQAIDVGTVKAVSAEAIRLLLCVLGFLTFGYGSKEFEVTSDRLGCYRPEDHIDNPKNYADNIDARRYDTRLRGPVDERVELGIDPETGMKNYIANEGANIMTSAYHVRQLFGRCIELGRSYRRTRNKDDFYEALRLLGTGLHCLEDYLAHSNYTELALIEMGERDVFPHVGRSTRIRLNGANGSVYPVITGTFGGVDFLHSVTGEVSDKLTQNEIQELEGTLQQSQNADTSVLAKLLDMIPDGIFGGSDKKQKMNDIQSNAAAAQMQQMSVSPREPEEFTRYIKDVFNQIMPAITYHDEILQNITEAVEKIPVLPQMIEQLEDQLSVFVFSVIAPFVVPVIQQIQAELATGSSEIIQSSQAEQLIVFNDDNCTDPTHSMLSKDHFSNILNEIAGRTASKVVAWTVPQIMNAWDDDNIDVSRTLNRIVNGVLHHPAQREQGSDGASDCRAIMYSSVQQWWQDMSDDQREDYRRKLSREGVENGENHKEGVEDSGHGCGHPLKMQKNVTGFGSSGGNNDLANAAAGAVLGGLASSFAGGNGGSSGSGGLSSMLESFSSGNGGSNSGSGGGLGGLLGAAGSLLGSNFEEKTSQVSNQYQSDGGHSQTYTQYGRNEESNQYAQAQYTRTDYPDGGERTEYRRYDQESSGGHGGGRGQAYEEETETRPTYGGGFEQRQEERRWDGEGRSEYREEERREEHDNGGGRWGEERRSPPRHESPPRGWGGGGGEERREERGGWGGGGGDDERREERGGWGGGGGGDDERREERGGWGGGGGDDERREERGGWGGDGDEERRDEERRDDGEERGGWGF
ncbi:nima-interacting protein [Ophiostoma piceae UAMH 11346]|uniref:Nima-interacting protein n=1 Tax=Ophiostoma piceae (strain UAMH 11346) TaxID=1262450 RepID=S3CYL3_OPHP1|nr:nima-interacting protein [Ophiostoma piceae UAMH 11346]